MGRNLIISNSLMSTGPITRPFGTGSVLFFTSSATWTVPSGIRAVRVRVWGGGANGVSDAAAGKGPASGRGGGGGGFAIKVISGLTPGSNFSITVPDISPAYAAAGGTCSFGSNVTATGGTSGGVGGSGSGGDFNYTGGSGSGPFNAFLGGGGVANLFGNGGNGANTSNNRCISSASGGGGLPRLPGGNSLFAQGGLAPIYHQRDATSAQAPMAAIAGYMPTSGNEQNLLDLIGVGGGGGGGFQTEPVASAARNNIGQGGINGGGGGALLGPGGFPGGGAGGGSGMSLATGVAIGAPGLVVVEW